MSLVGSSLLRWAALSLLVAGAFASSGCSATSCDTSRDPNPDKYTGGTVEGGVFMSTPWTGPLLNFPGGKQYNIIHNLGCMPRVVSLWVSFDQRGLSEGGASIAPSAGNMAEVEALDETRIQIRNSTCSDLFVLVTLSCGDSTSHADAGVSDALSEAASTDAAEGGAETD